jgi:VWA domain-containing protein
MCGSSYLRILFLGLAVLTWHVRPVGSQESPCTNRKLPVFFRDAQNLPLQNISVSDLEGKVHGKPVKILSLAPDVRPHRIILILDASGSMGSEASELPVWDLEFSLARHFFEVNRQRSQIALLFFNDKVNEVIDFSERNSAVADRLQQVGEDHDYLKKHIKGKTALRDAILQGVQLLDHPTSADAVYVLTDGGDNASTHSTSDLIRRLAVTPVRIFAVLLYRSAGYRTQTSEEISGPDELSEVALKSGGEILTAAQWHFGRIALSADAERKLKTEETLSRLYQAIMQDSLLEIQLPFPIEKNERWELKLSGAARRQWKGAQITYPTTLTSCNAEVFGSSRN